MFLAYKKGLTPNPDITCNTIIKFPLLWQAALKLHADYIATGHYARIKKTKSASYNLLAGKDKTKDQSYFLSELTQSDLQHTLFPIGNYTKTQVRRLAKKLKLPNHSRPGTKGICFVGNVPMKSFLQIKLKQKPGKVLDDNGKVIGTHTGSHCYTIGERARPSVGIIITKGSNSQKRFFIAEKNLAKNTLLIVPEGNSMLKKNNFTLKNVHWINSKDKKLKLRAKVRVRHLGELMPSTLELKDNKWHLTLHKPVASIAPGQSAVFYIKDQLVCSGEISSLE